MNQLERNKALPLDLSRAKKFSSRETFQREASRRAGLGTPEVSRTSFCGIDPAKAQLLALALRMIFFHSLVSFRYDEGLNCARALERISANRVDTPFGSVGPQFILTSLRLINYERCI